MKELQAAIDEAFERRADLTPRSAEANVRDAVDHVLEMLDAGRLRVAEKVDGRWVTHQWIKKAVLLSFRLEDNAWSRRLHQLLRQGAAPSSRDYGARDFRSGRLPRRAPGGGAPRRLHRDATSC